MFRVFHQVSHGRYNVHFFDDQMHFRAWMAVHPTTNMVHLPQGSKGVEYDHTGDYDDQVESLRIGLHQTAATA